VYCGNSGDGGGLNSNRGSLVIIRPSTTDRNLRNIVNFRRVCNPEDNVFKLLWPSSSNNSITDKPVLFKSDIGEFPKNCGTVTVLISIGQLLQPLYTWVLSVVSEWPLVHAAFCKQDEWMTKDHHYEIWTNHCNCSRVTRWQHKHPVRLSTVLVTC
jgi:hypothetical protein